MKQKDMTLVVVMAFISVVLALVLSRVMFSTPQNREQTAEVVDAITAEFPQPSSKYFNADSVNPTQQIQIGGGNPNPNPFNANPQ